MKKVNYDLIEKITNDLSTVFERNLFKAAIGNLLNASSPIRFNNFAYAIRELIRNILDRLAPDDEVLASAWYKNETQTEKGISRRQRIYYAIHGGLSPEFIKNVLEIDTESYFENFQEILNNLHKFTHITEATFGIEEGIVFDFANQTLENILAFFQLITATKVSLEEALISKIDTALIDTMLEKTFDEIDILATHHYLEEIHVEEYNLLEIDHEFMFFETIGVITYELQWGSNHDLKVGDGLLASESFPFECKLKINVVDMNEIIIDEESIVIETDETNGMDDHDEPVRKIDA